jgi:hypothetical protein
VAQRHSRSQQTKARHDGRLTEASHVDDEHKDMKCPGAMSH